MGILGPFFDLVLSLQLSRHAGKYFDAYTEDRSDPREDRCPIYENDGMSTEIWDFTSSPTKMQKYLVYPTVIGNQLLMIS